MSERMQEAALAAVQLLGLVIAGVVLYQLGQTEVGSLVIGAALGHAAPRRRRGERGSVPPAAPLVMLLGALALGGAVSGCGASAAQTLASAQATVLVTHQAARIDFYESESARCRAASSTFDAWEVCMRPAVAVQRTADSYRSTLEATQATIDAVGADNAKGAITCSILAAVALVRAADEASAPIPQQVRDLAALVPEVPCGQ